MHKLGRLGALLALALAQTTNSTKIVVEVSPTTIVYVIAGFAVGYLLHRLFKTV